MVEVLENQAWQHLARLPNGTPVASHSPGDKESGFVVTLVDPNRQLFLGLTQRCGICGYKLNGQGVCVLAESGNFDEEYFKLSSTDEGLVQVVAKGLKYRELSFLSEEGLVHKECVAAAKSMCPYLASDKYVYKAKAEFPHGYPTNFDELDEETLAEKLGEEEALVAEHVGRVSGRKWIVVPQAIELTDSNQLLVGMKTPFFMTEAGSESYDSLQVDIDDPIPSAITDLSIAASVALGEFMISGVLPTKSARNEPCECGSEKKKKKCHPNGLIPTSIVAEFRKSPLVGYKLLKRNIAKNRARI